MPIFSKECTGPYIDSEGNHKLQFPNGCEVLTAEESVKVLEERFGKNWEKYEVMFGERDKKFWRDCENLKNNSKLQ